MAESPLKQQSQRACHDAQGARQRSIGAQARAEELAHHAERLFTRVQELKDNMNEAANKASLRRKASTKQA